jgi:GT2 family glycosyltransferase
LAPPSSHPISSEVRVGILVLNYHHPRETLECIRSLLIREPSTSRILWLENDADATWAETRSVLESSGIVFQVLDADAGLLPPQGVVGVVLNRENLGFAGGNNVGLRLLHRLQVPFAWVLNNDILVKEGNSHFLVCAAEARPEVGLWGTTIRSANGRSYSGGLLNLGDFSIEPVLDPGLLEGNPLSFVSGCSLFFRNDLAHQLGYIPEDYFLYYEDPAFTMEVRRLGLTASACLEVVVLHEESLSTGHRSPVMEYYSRRNRWAFIQRYFPERLRAQRRNVWYRFQSLLFRGAFRRAILEWLAMKDWKAGKMGRTTRALG